MKRLFLFFIFLIFSKAFAIVDMKNANYSDSTLHLRVPGTSGYELEVILSYNSRTIYNGIFGFGWCSDFESRLEITGEGNMKVIECGAGSELLYVPKKFDPKKVDETVDYLVKVIKEKNPKMSDDALKKYKQNLSSDSIMRDEFVRVFNRKGAVVAGQPYYFNGRENEFVVQLNSGLDEEKEGGYKRTLPDNKYELFNKEGRIIAKFDRLGNYLKFFYVKNQLNKVIDNQGRTLLFTYDPKTKKVKKIVGPSNMTVNFTTKGEDLVEVNNALNQKYKYFYDDVHNLVQLILPDGKTKKLSYNKDKDWVVSFTNEKGCIEKYTYVLDSKDPKNHFTSNVVKSCNGEVTNQNSYEFFNKPRLDKNGVYLSRVKSTVNGVLTDIFYHETLGKPVTIIRGKFKTEYTYYDTGLVRTKKELGQSTSFEYKNNCNKVSKVQIDYFDLSGSEKEGKSTKSRLHRSVFTNFNYENQKCNLLFAQNSDGMSVKIQYDSRGRISIIEDQSKKIVKIKYDERYGKPEIVNRPGLGSIKVTYKNENEIKSVDSKDGPKVAVQVASIFNSLLEIIAPASAESNL
ncbi:MAG: cell wall-associated protein wapA [Bdellovibrionales bacterium]|nr:cell wall-associated protein wapA [Bdellovibrionales bacterium]